MQRILRNTRRTIQHTFEVGTTPTDPDGNVATVDITRGDGSTSPAPVGLNQATTRTGIGIYEYTLAPQADLERFTFLFEGTFGGVAQQSTPTIVEVAGSFYVPLVDIRALDGLDNATTFPNAKLEEARIWFEDLAENYCKVAFVPRYRHEWQWGDGSDVIFLRRSPLRRLLSVKVDGVAQTFTGWTVEENGKVTRDTGTFTFDKRVEVTYEHGKDEPDADLREASLTAIRAHLLESVSGIPSRMTSMVTEFGTVLRNAPLKPTGIPSVDEVLNRPGRTKAKIPLVG